MLPKLSRNTKLLSMASFLTDVSSEMIIPLLPFFLTHVLWAPVFIVGWMEGLREFTANVTGIVSGIYADRMGRRKRMILTGYSLSAVAKAFLLAATSGLQVMAIVFFERMGKGIRKAPRDALMVQSEPPENLGKAIGFRKMMDNMGAIAGPVIAGFMIAVLVDTPDAVYRTIFLVALVPAILAVIVLFFIQEKPMLARPTRTIVMEVWRTKNFKRLAVSMGVFALGAFSVPLFLLRAGSTIPLLMVPIAYLAYNVFFTIFSVPAGYATDRWGSKKTLMLAQMIFLVVLTGFAAGVSELTAFLLMGLLGVFMAIYDTAPRVWMAKMVDEKNYASAIGMYGGIVGMAALPANGLAGILWDIRVAGVPAVFLFPMVTTVLGMALLQWLVKE